MGGLMISGKQVNSIKEEDIQWLTHRSDDLEFLYKKKHKYAGNHKKEVSALHSFIITTCGSTAKSLEERFRLGVQAIHNHATIGAQRLKLTKKDGSGEIDWPQVITYINEHKKKDFYLRELLGTLDQLNYSPVYQPFLNEDLKRALDKSHIKLYGLTEHLLGENTVTLFQKKYTTSGLPPATNPAVRKQANLAASPNTYTSLKELKL